MRRLRSGRSFCGLLSKSEVSFSLPLINSRGERCRDGPERDICSIQERSLNGLVGEKSKRCCRYARPVNHGVEVFRCNVDSRQRVSGLYFVL